MALLVQLSREDGSDTLTFAGIPTPWPENPEPEREQFGSKVRTVPTVDDDDETVLPGRTLRFKFGHDITSETIKLRIPLAQQETKDAIMVLRDEEENLQYSDDGGTTVWLVTLEPDEKVNPKFTPKPGYVGLWEIEMLLGKLELLAPGS